MLEQLAPLFVGILMVILTAGLAWVGSQLVALKRRIDAEGEQWVRDILPDEVEAVLEDAVRTATTYIEALDRDGRLTELVGEITDKAKQKLYTAVKLVIEWSELRIEETTGIHIDIPEDQVIALIERYIFENPELFNGTVETSG